MKSLLDNLTKEEYLELWEEKGDDFEVAKALFVSKTFLERWKVENGLRGVIAGIRKKRRIEMLEYRVKKNNEMKKKGLTSREIYEDLDFQSVQSYWYWCYTTREKGYVVL